MQLTNEEKTIAARIGVSEAEFIAQKSRNSVAQMTVSADPRSAPFARLLPQLDGLSDVDRNVIRATKVHPLDYAAVKATGNIAIGLHRETILQDAMRDATAADCAREAIKELEAFIRDAEHLESMQNCINASGLIESALKKVGARRRAAGGY